MWKELDDETVKELRVRQHKQKGVKNTLSATVYNNLQQQHN